MLKSTSLTIVVPTYNGIATIADTLDSVRNQSRQDFRVLYVDDGSTDGTARAVEKALRPGDRLEYKKNSGLYDTLNQALLGVESEWVSLLFQDDTLRSDYVQRCLDFIERETTAELIWFAIDIIDENSEILTRGIDEERTELIRPGVSTWRNTLLSGTYWTISGSLSKVACLQQLAFRADLPHCADYELLLRAVRQHSLLYVESPLVMIRQHVGQASAKNLENGLDILERLKVLQEAIDRHPEDVDAGFRFRLASRMVLQVLKRALGHARRGRFANGVRTLSFVPTSLSLAIGSGKAGPRLL